jgi:4-amino-4-deoxy-L-arabinose transferase-like glycosyltransferase
MFVLAAYYVVQKPIGIVPLQGLAQTFWTILLAAVIMVLSFGLGLMVINLLKPASIDPAERLLLSLGLGLGIVGLIGFAFAAVGLAKPVVYAVATLIGLIFVLANGSLKLARDDGRFYLSELGGSFRSVHIALKVAIFIILGIALLQALAPPDAFDALLYHLEFPARILKDSGIHPYDVAQFWFPSLPESAFLWVMALGSDRTPQLIHLLWMIISLGLIWKWARLWNDQAAWLAIAILISMPSLSLVASWAYTDFALTCLALSSLYSVVRYTQEDGKAWLLLSGIFAGMAMGVKYTSFILPVAEVVLILWWGRKTFRKAVYDGAVFSLIAVVIASPWYLRNWVVMNNPVYPFVFNGRYWDALRASLYEMKGTGLGWNIKELVMLPLAATLGYHDANYYDGRVGPLFLLLIPLIIIIFWQGRRESLPRKYSLLALGIFSFLSVLFWTLGVINTQSLWQVRLLYPVVFALSIPAALGILLLGKLNTEKLKVGSLFNVILGIVIGVTVLESVLFFSRSNPLPVELGTEQESKYLSRVIPTYSEMLNLLNSTPKDSKIYALFEPRSYRSPRWLQPDPVVDQLARDINLYGSAQNVVDAWRDQGYSHVLIYRWGVNFLDKNQPSVLTPQRKAILDQIIRDYLRLVGTTSEGDYELYEIPSK